MCAILFNAPSNMRLKSLPVKAMDSLILRHLPNVMPDFGTGDQLHQIFMIPQLNDTLDQTILKIYYYYYIMNYTVITDL